MSELRGTKDQTKKRGRPLTDAENARVDEWYSKGRPSDPASIAAVFGWEYDEGEES